MATYPEIAPIISSTGTTKTSINDYFSNLPGLPEPPEPPVITKAKIVIIADAYLIDGIEKSNGTQGIATKAGLLAWQVKAVIREIEALKSLWIEANSVEEEPDLEEIISK